MDKTKRQNVGIIDKVNKTTLAEATGKGGGEVAAGTGGVPEAGLEEQHHLFLVDKKRK